ncbi:MAG: ATP-binding protein [Spirochaetaceae bacterium]|nr:ATP-binding protein [Spirochaetaceae bacterium]
MWINRCITERVGKAVNSRPAVLLTGARQTGKTSLLRRQFPDTEYLTFDHLIHLSTAKEAPEHFLQQFRAQVILDEIQYVPELFRELKVQIDNDRDHYGKWILTGSQQFELMQYISESLAGRISIMHLETLSAAELRSGHINNYNNHLWRGGYPELWSNPKLDISDFFESYIRTYIERDLKEIVDVKNLNDFRRFILVLASRAGQLLNYKNISADTGISDVTVKKWIHALQIGGLVFLLPPYFTNIGKRMIKSPKLYFADHGLLCHLLGIRSELDWLSHSHKGNLWENFVMMELLKNYSLIPGRNLFFYRDQNGVEIDFVIEKKGVLYFIEAKVGENIDKRKLNFNKVLPLFANKSKTEAILAQNIKENRVVRLDGFSCYNPLLTSLDNKI